MTDTVWYYAVGNKQRRPVEKGKVSALVARGEIGPETLVWREGIAEWTTARSSLPGDLVPQSWVDGMSSPATQLQPPSFEQGSTSGT